MKTRTHFAFCVDTWTIDAGIIRFGRRTGHRRTGLPRLIAPDLGKPEIGSSNAPSDRSISGQRKHRELAAERCVVLQGSIAANCAQAGGGIRQPGGKTDTCPAADAGQDRHPVRPRLLKNGRTKWSH
jgi:hypothetical protein